MLVKLVYDSGIARFLGVGAITLYPFILFNMTRQEAIDNYTLDHEFVHVRQVRKLGWLRFYASYLWKYIKGLVKTRSHTVAYFCISYEQEAYAAGRIEFTDAEVQEISAAHGEPFVRK